MGISQDDLAVRSGIDSANIRGYESGRAMMNIHTLVRISEALGVSPSELLDGVQLDMFEARARSGRRAAG